MQDPVHRGPDPLVRRRPSVPGQVLLRLGELYLLRLPREACRSKRAFVVLLIRLQKFCGENAGEAALLGSLSAANGARGELTGDIACCSCCCGGDGGFLGVDGVGVGFWRGLLSWLLCLLCALAYLSLLLEERVPLLPFPLLLPMM